MIYGSYGYGLRVQDREICLLEPDVIKVYGVFESSDTGNPELPTISLFNLNGPTGKTDDYNIGEEITGQKSGAIAIVYGRQSSSILNIVYVNDIKFENGESVLSETTGITATINDFTPGDNNILNRYSLDSGQRDTILDYSRLIRRTGTKESQKISKNCFPVSRVY